MTDDLYHNYLLVVTEIETVPVHDNPLLNLFKKSHQKVGQF